MTDKEHTPRARMTPPGALALPHVVEAIATGLNNQDDLKSFLHAVPRSLWTPALTAFLACSTAMPSSVRVNWPHIKLRDMDLPPSVLALLAATLPLCPRIELEYVIWNAARLAPVVAVVGPALSRVFLPFSSDFMVQGRGRAISSLLLQRCPRLRQVSIAVLSCSENDAVELNGLLAVVTHPHLSVLSIYLRSVTTAPRLGHHLAAWLSTAPATILRLDHEAQIMDHDGAIAFCDALQSSTTLTELTIGHVPSLGGFYGRTLPVSLKTLKWNVCFGAVDDTALTDLATAVGRTQLERLSCSVFGQLATYPAAAPMLAQLKCLIVSGLEANHMPALIAGLSSVPALTSLELCECNLSLSTELLMETLATTCVHLKTLGLWDCADLTRDGATAVFAGVLRLPQLILLDLKMRSLDVLHVLPALIAAGRHLRRIDLKIIERYNDPEKRAIYRALALIQNVPFALKTFPEDMDASVVNALGRRADRRHTCELHLTSAS